ncbi:MAG: dynamin family protein [Oscillospiraceae bacterium]|nr:dynamin family protein [Oscillospiraceae bacterium]
MNKNKYDNAEYDIALVRGDLKRLLKDQELCGILGEDATNRMKKWDQIIEKKLTEPFSLVIVGDFKRGKSTVINAILGRSVAPVNVAPETFTINRFSYGENPNVEAVLGNGKRVTLTQDDLSRERLLGLLDFFPGSLEYIDVKSDAPILKEIQVVDTPGLSDLDELDSQVKEFLVKADAVIYVASALSPFSESEQYFIASQIVPQNFSKVFVLINMIDAIDTMEDIERIINHIREKCAQIIPVAEVYGISGIDEYRRKIGLNRPDIKGFQEFYENQFLKFELALSREVIVQKDTLRTQRVFSMLSMMMTDTLNRLGMISDMLKMDSEKLEKLQADFDKECENLATALENQKPKILLSITEMKQEAEYWMYEFFVKLREDIVASRQTTTAEDVERHFYSYLMDKVGEAYRRCLEIHQERLNGIINDMGVQLSRKLGIADLAAARISTSETVNVNSFVADKIKQAASQGAERSVGFPSGTMPFFRNIMKKNRQSDIIDTTLENYDDIRSSTIKDLKECYKNFEQFASDQLDEIYRTQEAVGRETVTQALEMARSEESTDRINKCIDRANEIISGSVEVLREYI